jgi:hypothetical protein
MRMRILALLPLLSACAGDPILEGRDLFNAGSYAEAQARLEKVRGDDYKELEVHQKATYCLYRGLVFGALGDRKNAAAWLGLAQETEERYPGSLRREDMVRLRNGDRKYGPLPPTSEPPGL